LLKIQHCFNKQSYLSQ